MEDTLINRIEEIKKSTIDELTTNIKAKNRQQTGDLKYPEITQQIESFQQMLQYFDSSNFNLLPNYRVRLFEVRITPILEKIAAIQLDDRDPQQPDDQQKRRILEFFKTDYNIDQNIPDTQIFQRSVPVIWQIIVESLALKVNTITAISDIESTKEKAEKVLDGILDKEIEAGKIVDAARLDLSKGGVGKHAISFSEQADVHKTNAARWRKYTIWLLCTTVFLIILLFFTIVFWICDDNLSDKIETGISGALLISFLSYGIVLCVKNYFAEKHNEMINTHKANCLGTYNTFQNSADSATRQIILQYTTQTIFSHQKSGFLAGESDNQNPYPIIEIIKNFPTKSLAE